MRRFALLTAVPVLLVACSGDIIEVPSTTSEAATTTAVPTTSVTPATVADRYGLPDRVTVAVRAPELDLVLDLDVAPGSEAVSELSLFGRFASCSAVEGSEWLPFEVVVDEGPGRPAVRIIDVGGASSLAGSSEIRVRIDDGAGGVVEATGGATRGDDGTSGTWSATTVDGAVVSGSYTCEGTIADEFNDHHAEISARLVDESTGIARTVGARSGAESLCLTGSEIRDLLRIDEADQPAGGLIAATITADEPIAAEASGHGVLTLTVPGGGLRFADVEITRIGDGGVISGDDGAGRRIDAAWSCR